jgi:hypothetical protein
VVLTWDASSFASRASIAADCAAVLCVCVWQGFRGACPGPRPRRGVRQCAATLRARTRQGVCLPHFVPNSCCARQLQVCADGGRCAGSDPPPGKEAKDGKEGWTKEKLPDGRMVWTATPKNAVERISSILVIERKSTSARYFCLKCSSTFFGSKKRIKEHLRGENKDVKHCTQPVTAEEEAVFLEDDKQDTARGPRQACGQDGDGIKSAPRKRKRLALVDQRNSDSKSPFPCNEPPPAPEGWRKVKDPRFTDERWIWVAEPKNDVERMLSVLVVERRTTTCRYLCTKCNFLYWGSKKRVKEHLRDLAGDVKGCAVRITAEEENLLRQDDAMTRVRPTRVRYRQDEQGENGEEQGFRPPKRVRTGPGKARPPPAETASPFMATEPPPDEEGWTKGKAPDGAEIWISEPKNAVERLAAVIVIERRPTAARYMCTKCNLMFWGSKKRVKEHLRRQGNSVTGCAHEPTYEEEEVMRTDDPEGEADGCFESPSLASGPPPSDEGWCKGVLPDGKEIWVVQPKNAVERLDSVLVLERRNKNSRYCCTKCGLFFWGTKKKLKEHIRRNSRDMKPCSVDPSAHEIDVLETDDAVLPRSGLQFCPPHPRHLSRARSLARCVCVCCCAQLLDTATPRANLGDGVKHSIDKQQQSSKDC